VSSTAAPEVSHEGHQHNDHTDEDHHHQAELQKIENLRKKLAESGNDHLAFYSLECQSFEEIK
jgi:hypothetical protein